MTKQLYRILVINPGSTSTKIALFENDNCTFSKSIQHDHTNLEQFPELWDQYAFRKSDIVSSLEEAGKDIAALDAVVGRGGLLKPLQSGTYVVDDHMVSHLREGIQGEHASNLGGALALDISGGIDKPAYIVDPVAVDEFADISRLSGMPDIPRTSLLHALNIKATARKAARDLARPVEELRLVVAHLGGGITVAAIERGRIVDSNNGIGEGPFSPQRTGALPLAPLVEMCFSQKFTKKDIMRKIVGGGGLIGYLGTDNAGKIEEMINTGDRKARLAYEAMAYQIAQEIAARTVALEDKNDCILLTGGLAHSKMLTDWIKTRCRFLGEVRLYPGENELESLAEGGLRVLRGEEEPRIYDEEGRSTNHTSH